MGGCGNAEGRGRLRKCGRSREVVEMWEVVEGLEVESFTLEVLVWWKVPFFDVVASQFAWKMQLA